MKGSSISDVMLIQTIFAPSPHRHAFYQYSHQTLFFCDVIYGRPPTIFRPLAGVPILSIDVKMNKFLPFVLQKKISASNLLWQCPDSFATKYDEAKPVFLLGKLSADRILALTTTKANGPLIFEVSRNLGRLYKLLTYFEGQVLKPTTHERVGKMNKRRLNILKSLQISDRNPNERIVLLQVLPSLF